MDNFRAQMKDFKNSGRFLYNVKVVCRWSLGLLWKLAPIVPQNSMDERGRALLAGRE